MSSHKTIDDEDSQILPVGWRKCWSVRKARVYYFNLESGNSSWERPTDVTQIGLFQEHDSSAVCMNFVSLSARGWILDVRI